jgi:hypothetical protein
MASSHVNSSRQNPPEHSPAFGSPGFCEEKHRLIRDFLQAIHELNGLQKQQTQAVIDGDPDFSRFDVLLHLAQEKKDNAKYAWMAHVEAHRCEEG